MKRRAVVLVEVLLLQQLQEPAEREQRRAQLVRRGRDEALARVVELGELAAHLLQRVGELAELVVRVDREARGQVALGDAVGDRLQAPDAQRHVARDQPRRERGQDQRGERRLAGTRSRTTLRRRSSTVVQRPREDEHRPDDALVAPRVLRRSAAPRPRRRGPRRRPRSRSAACRSARRRSRRRTAGRGSRPAASSPTSGRSRSAPGFGVEPEQRHARGRLVGGVADERVDVARAVAAVDRDVDPARVDLRGRHQLLQRLRRAAPSSSAFRTAAPTIATAAEDDQRTATAPGGCAAISRARSLLHQRERAARRASRPRLPPSGRSIAPRRGSGSRRRAR